MNKGIAIAAVGAIVLALSLLADQIGIGQHPDTFGLRQTSGSVVGAILLVAGLVMSKRKT